MLNKFLSIKNIIWRNRYVHAYLQFLYKDIRELIITLVILVRPNFIFKGKNMIAPLFYFINSTYNHSSVSILLA